MVVVELFLFFMKIGLFSFGGGYAMISLLQKEVVEKGYMNIAEFMEIVAVSQITPGPIAVNMATFVGFRQAGAAGSVVATLGVCFPSFILVYITMAFLKAFKTSRGITYVFDGLRPAVVGLIGAACVQIGWLEFFPGSTVLEWASINETAVFSIVICFIGLFLLYRLKISPVMALGLSALAGIVFFA